VVDTGAARAWLDRIDVVEAAQEVTGVVATWKKKMGEEGEGNEVSESRRDLENTDVTNVHNQKKKPESSLKRQTHVSSSHASALSTPTLWGVIEDFLTSARVLN